MGRVKAEQVRALQVGETVRIRKEGQEPVICTVAFRGQPVNKFLTCWDRGQIKTFAIRDYPGREYQLCGRLVARECERNHERKKQGG